MGSKAMQSLANSAKLRIRVNLPVPWKAPTLVIPEDIYFGSLLTFFIDAQSTEKDAFVPSRRVRTVPGGPHTDIFARDDEDDALSQAPPPPAKTAEVRPS